MKIEEVLNNNMVLTRNSEGKEVILKGKSLGFGKKKGDEVDRRLVERVFVQNDKRDARHFEEYLAKLPQTYWEICEQAVDRAREEYGMKLESRVIIPLCDHIAGTVERSRSGTFLKNDMFWEVKRFYPDEFQMGRYMVELMERRLQLSMGKTEAENEAAFLAMHFIAGRLEAGGGDEIRSVTRIIQEVIQIVEACYQVKLDEESWDYQRFVNHIRFFAQRMFSHKRYEETDGEWFGILKEKYRQTYNCIVKIADYIYDRYSYEMDREEMMYLMIHIEKVTRGLKQAD